MRTRVRTTVYLGTRYVAYDVTITATQTFNNGTTRPLHCDARSRYEGESRHREQERGVQGGPRGRATAHQPPHQVRGAGLRIVKLDGLYSAEAGQQVGAAGFATFGPDRRQGPASTRHLPILDRILERVSLILHLGVQVPVVG